jgi:hypothetical protein
MRAASTTASRAAKVGAVHQIPKASRPAMVQAMPVAVLGAEREARKLRFVVMPACCCWWAPVRQGVPTWSDTVPFAARSQGLVSDGWEDLKVRTTGG